MSKTSESSRAKSIRDALVELTYGAPPRPPGWKTKQEWISDANIPLRTFENQLQKLLALGHAKKAKFTNEHGRPKWYFWINKLSDEYQD